MVPNVESLTLALVVIITERVILSSEQINVKNIHENCRFTVLVCGIKSYSETQETQVIFGNKGFLNTVKENFFRKGNCLKCRTSSREFVLSDGRRSLRREDY